MSLCDYDVISEMFEKEIEKQKQYAAYWKYVARRYRDWFKGNNKIYQFQLKQIRQLETEKQQLQIQFDKDISYLRLEEKKLKESVNRQIKYIENLNIAIDSKINLINDLKEENVKLKEQLDITTKTLFEMTEAIEEKEYYIVDLEGKRIRVDLKYVQQLETENKELQIKIDESNGWETFHFNRAEQLKEENAKMKEQLDDLLGEENVKRLGI